MHTAAARKKLSTILALITLMTVFAIPGPALAADIVVDCDSGGVLQTAINASTPGDRILVSGTCTENIVIDLLITGITIEGDGAGVTFLDGGLADSVIRITAGRTVTISDLTIQNGATSGVTEGGGIWSAGTLILNNVDIVNNSTTANGGGIFAGGSLTVNGGKINDNSAVFDGGGVYTTGTALFDSAAEIGANGAGNTAGRHGGGIYSNNGVVTLQNDTHLFDNSAADSGGGIYNSGGSLTVSFAAVNGNTATVGGGGIYNVGAGVLSMTGSSVDNNTAGAAAGILSADPSTTASITDSFIRNNGAINPAGSGGGGIENATSGTMTIDNTVISGNTSASNGGAGIHNSDSDLTISDSQITTNSATGTSANGGGIRTSGTLTVDGGTLIQSNTATVGGGIYVAGALSTFDLTDSRIDANTSTSGGGGVHIDPTNIVTVTRSSVTRNTAAGNGGGISNFGGDVTLTNSTISSNTGGSGGGIGSNAVSGTVSSLYSTITNNTATSAGGGVVNAGALTIEGTILFGNTAPTGVDCSGPVSTTGYNLVGETTAPCTFTPTGTDLPALSDPLLGPLTAGVTDYHPLLAGSDAIDAGGACGLLVDQLGNARPDGPACDVGSIEGTSVVVADEVVLVEPNGRWHIRVPGNPDYTFFYGVPGDIPLFGDWDGDGLDTPGAWRQGPGGGFAYLTNTLPPDAGVGVADFDFFFGIPGDEVFSGDWNGDNIDTLGINRAGRIFLTDTNGSGGLPVPTDYDFFFGVPGDRAFGGDGDGDGDDGVFLYRETDGFVYYTNETPTTGVAPTADNFFFGIPSDSFVSGDWNADLVDTAGIFRGSNGTIYLSNTNASGGAPAPTDETIVWGTNGWIPRAGVTGIN